MTASTVFAVCVGIAVGPQPTQAPVAEDLPSVMLREGRTIPQLMQLTDLTGEERATLTRILEDYGADSRDGVGELIKFLQSRMEVARYGPSTLAIAMSALRMGQSYFGQDDPYLAEPLLIHVGYLLHIDSKLEAAKEAYTWSLRLTERAKGEESVEVATILSRLTGLYYDLNENDEAERAAQRSLSIAVAEYGESHPRVALSIYSYGNLLFQLGKYEAALAQYERAVAILEPHPTEEGQLARGLHNIGIVYHRLGRIEESEAFLRRALRMRLRTDHPDETPWPVAASTYSALGDVERDRGDFVRAEQDFEKALAIMPDWFGRDAHRYAETLGQLAGLLDETGDRTRALDLQTQSLRIRLDKLEANDRRVAYSRSRLGLLLIQDGNLTRAGRELNEALGIQEQKLGRTHPELAETLGALALWHERRNELEPARACLDRAIGIYEAMSVDHAGLVEPVEQLARVLRKLGDEQGAARAIARGLRIAERVYGVDSPNVARLHSERARLLAVQNRNEEAIREVLEAESIARGFVRATVHALPEEQALSFVALQRGNLDLALSLLEDANPLPAPLVHSVWDAVIQSRALVLEALIARAQIVRALSEPELREAASSLSEARSRLAGLLVRGTGLMQPGTIAKLIDKARSEVRSAELELSAASHRFRSDERDDVGLADVIRALPKGAALVALTRFQDTRESHASEYRYGAFILSDEGAAVDFVALPGSADSIDGKVRDWRKLMPAGLDGRPASEAAVRKAGAELRAAVWEPLAPRFEAAAELFLVPEGSLNLVNPAALPEGADHYLLEAGPLLHFLTTERDLVAFQEERPRAEGLLAFGAADFDGQSGAVPSAETSRVAALGPTTRALKECEMKERRFVSLPGTVDEVRGLVALWTSLRERSRSLGDADALVGIEANEQNWKRYAPATRVLHLATHGFFRGAECIPERRGTRGIGIATSYVTSLEQYALSGLALAGVNRTGPLAPNEQDGYLTALEVASADLSLVEWAVLSACDTGVGDIRVGEGTFGLRRAFIIAGVRSLIMSLWTVDDAATPAWMSELYRARFERSLSTAEAVRAAANAVLKSRREKGLSTHPVFWAGFVATGDWK